MEAQTDVTRLLRAIEAGDETAESQLLDVVYDQIHEIAHGKMRGEEPGHTWWTTDLVHEWYLKWHSAEKRHPIENRRHLFYSVALAMRRLLVSHKRERTAAKRDERKLEPIFLDAIMISYEQSGLDFLKLEEGLAAMKRDHRRQYEILHLNFFAGLETKEIAELTELKLRTVQQHLAFAKAYLGDFA